VEAQLTVESGPSGRSVHTLVPGQTLTLGSDPGTQVVLNDPSVAPEHAAVRLDDKGLWVVDLGSPGGCRLNEVPLRPRVPAEAFGGDALRLGAHVIRLTLLGRGARTRRRAPSGSAQPLLSAHEFELVRVLGSGAAGKVFAARWLPRGINVAVKVLHEDIRPGSPEHERFVREASAVARLQCTYVVAVLELREQDERAFSVLELVEGPSVREVLQRGPLPIPHALRIAEDVARALAAASEEGIVHRDVKPANILLSPVGVAKLCDFGIAKDLDSTLGSLTASGMGLGTMAYLPPEQVSAARHVEPSADVYSLGATLYHMIAGRPPFRPTTAASLAQILREEPAPLNSLRPDAPGPVVAAVRALMAKAPDDRPPVWQVADRLKALREQLYPDAETESLFRGAR
jgi:serine/threonine protein kinase